MKENKNLLVLFPGKGYVATCPLLYYAYFKYERKGYECVVISYGDYNNINDARNNALAQISKLDFTCYGDIVFLSKSMGTIIAGWLEDKICENVRHIYLTPINDTLRYLKKEKNISIVIAGTNDPFLDVNILTAHCNQENIKVELIDGADHSLETAADVITNIDILKRVVELY